MILVPPFKHTVPGNRLVFQERAKARAKAKAKAKNTSTGQAGWEKTGGSPRTLVLVSHQVGLEGMKLALALCLGGLGVAVVTFQELDVNVSYMCATTEPRQPGSLASAQPLPGRASEATLEQRNL